MLDPIEKAEISAENAFFAMSQPDGKLKCGCGQVFDPDKEGGTVSPDPYAMPVCNRCLEEFDSHIKINQLQAESLAKDAQIVALRSALTRIHTCQDSPDIDLGGEMQVGLHCGVEDRGCQDRYDGADVGWSQGVERTLEWAQNEASSALSAPPPPVVPLEDVKPLLVAIQDAIITLGFGDDQSWLCRDRIKPALETFTAKYPTT